MAKKDGSIMYKCSNCGYSQPRWLGRCPECNEWNTLEEVIIDSRKITAAGRGTEEQRKISELNSKWLMVKGSQYMATFFFARC